MTLAIRAGRRIRRGTRIRSVLRTADEALLALWGTLDAVYTPRG